MKKKLILTVLIACVSAVFLCGSSAFAAGLGALEPKVDIDTVVLLSNQSTTVTADLTGPFDFEIVPVTLIGSGAFSASMSRTNTQGEIVYVMIQGFGVPSFDVNFGITPVSVRASSIISEEDDYAFGVVIHGILFSNEEAPYEYNVSLSY
jgi:hypothetical protein